MSFLISESEDQNPVTGCTFEGRQALNIKGANPRLVDCSGSISFESQSAALVTGGRLCSVEVRGSTCRFEGVEFELTPGTPSLLADGGRTYVAMTNCRFASSSERDARLIEASWHAEVTVIESSFDVSDGWGPEPIVHVEHGAAIKVADCKVTGEPAATDELQRVFATTMGGSCHVEGGDIRGEIVDVTPPEEPEALDDAVTPWSVKIEAGPEAQMTDDEVYARSIVSPIIEAVWTGNALPRDQVEALVEELVSLAGRSFAE